MKIQNDLSFMGLKDTQQSCNKRPKARKMVELGERVKRNYVDVLEREFSTLVR